jgi:hypothetical protein
MTLYAARVLPAASKKLVSKRVDVLQRQSDLEIQAAKTSLNSSIGFFRIENE